MGRSRTLLVGIAVAVIVATVWLISGPSHPRVQTNPNQARYTEALFAPDVVTFSPGIHMLGRMAPSVAYVIDTSDGFVLVDSGLDADCGRLLPQLSELGLDVSNLRAVLLTHAHGDHVLGAQRLRDLSGAKIYAGLGDGDVLQAGTRREAFFSTYPMDGFQIHPTTIDIPLKGDESIEIGETSITALATPGHTPGSMCYLVERDGLRILFTGDTISSLRGDLGTYSAYLAPRYRGNARDYLDTLIRLRAMPAPDLLMPGHPADSGAPHSPRLSRTQWLELLDRGIVDLRALIERYSTDGEDFLDGRPKQLLPGLHYLGEFGDRAVYVVALPTQQLLFNAPGGPGLSQFVTDGLRKAGAQSIDVTAVLMTSCDPDSTAGLGSLVQATDCVVVAADGAHSMLRAMCPANTKLISPQDLASQAWLPVRPILLEGVGVGETAYLIDWQEQRVLVSGVIPTPLDFRSQEKLVIGLRMRSIDPASYARSLQLLSHEDPNLWLPTPPTLGQNANLYGAQWQSVLQANLNALGGR